ncbi:MAG: septum formation protein [Lentisphaeria bacterium]|jgi:septum formation protein
MRVNKSETTAAPPSAAKYDLGLASSSPRRRELLDQIGVRHKVLEVNVPEQRSPGEDPKTYVRRLALEKAVAGHALDGSVPTLGADTVVVCSDQLFEKPKDEDDFYRMMTALSNSTHKVLTAIAIRDKQRSCVSVSTTEVTFKTVSREDMQRYWASGEPRDKAGGYAIQGMGAVLVASINGSFSGVVGLPLENLSDILTTVGVPVWNALG